MDTKKFCERLESYMLAYACELECGSIYSNWWLLLMAASNLGKYWLDRKKKKKGTEELNV